MPIHQPEPKCFNIIFLSFESTLMIKCWYFLGMQLHFWPVALLLILASLDYSLILLNVSDGESEKKKKIPSVSII